MKDIRNPVNPPPAHVRLVKVLWADDESAAPYRYHAAVYKSRYSRDGSLADPIFNSSVNLWSSDKLDVYSYYHAINVGSHWEIVNVIHPAQTDPVYSGPWSVSQYAYLETGVGGSFKLDNLIAQNSVTGNIISGQSGPIGPVNNQYLMFDYSISNLPFGWTSVVMAVIGVTIKRDDDSGTGIVSHGYVQLIDQEQSVLKFAPAEYYAIGGNSVSVAIDYSADSDPVPENEYMIPILSVRWLLDQTTAIADPYNYIRLLYGAAKV